jgi:plasmid stabilization system protein ParE
MNLIWTYSARSDLERLIEFLSKVNPNAAGRLALQLVQAPEILLEMPRLGKTVERYHPREVRQMITGNYVFH